MINSKDKLRRNVFSFCTFLLILIFVLFSYGCAGMRILGEERKILENLAAENLRAKDQAPVENFRIDSLVDALQKAKILDKNKKILPLPELQEVLLLRMGALGQKPAHKYKYTFDAAEHMLLAIMNCMYRNEGMEELTELPEDAKFPEYMKCEFAEEPNEEEQKAYSELGLLRKKH